MKVFLESEIYFKITNKKFLQLKKLHKIQFEKKSFANESRQNIYMKVPVTVVYGEPYQTSKMKPFWILLRYLRDF